MKTFLLAVLLSLGDEPTHPVVIELDNVCGRNCVAILEKALGRIDGVKSAEMYGDKFHFKLEVLDTKALLPAAVLKVTEKIRNDSKGEEDFPLLSFEVTVAGTVDGPTFTARGSGQKYALNPGEALKGFAAAGKAKLTLTGRVTEAKGKPLPVLEVTEAKETPQ
ncbi:MAG: hypothetical protein JO332_12000 [Planctomycetaceae bacterium]|nr:hypothetical protein [Planctomycetaceae bacterium]